MEVKDVIGNLELPEIKKYDAPRPDAALVQIYQNIINNNQLDVQETLDDTLKEIHNKITELQTSMNEAVYKSSGARKDSRAGRPDRIMTEISKWLMFEKYYEYYYSDHKDLTDRLEFNELSIALCSELEKICTIPGGSVQFDIGHEKIEATVVSGKPKDMLVGLAALLVSYMRLRIKEDISENLVHSIMSDMEFKAGLLSETYSEPALHVGYMNPDQELKYYLDKNFPEFDIDKYSYIYKKEIKNNLLFEFIQSQLVENCMQRIDRLLVMSKCPDTTPLYCRMSVQEYMNTFMGGTNELLTFRFAKFVWLMKSGIAYDNQQCKYSYEEIEKYVQEEIKYYLKYGRFVEL